MKRHIQIKNGYGVWKPSKMRVFIVYNYRVRYCERCDDLTIVNDKTLIIEWWLHNIGYCLTKPFVKLPGIGKLNRRFEDVDLMVDMKESEEEK